MDIKETDLTFTEDELNLSAGKNKIVVEVMEREWSEMTSEFKKIQ